MDDTEGSMELRVLGCSGGIGKGLRTTSFLLNDDVLIDAGTGVCDLTIDEMRRIRHVFVTHSHLDHVVSIPMLVDSLFSSLEQPLVVHALPQTIAAIREHLFNWTIWPDFSELPNQDSAVLRFEPMLPGEALHLDSGRITMVEVAHAVPAAGFIATGASGRSFCFTGDTGPNDSLWAALNQLASLELLIVETGFSDQEADLAQVAGHYTPSSLATDLQKLEHTPQIAISHLKTGIEARTMREVEVALADRDVTAIQVGDRFTI